MTIAFFCVLLAALLPLFCAFYAKIAAGFEMRRDNGDPRAFLARSTGIAARANAAQQNGYEVFAPFAAAVIIAHISGNAAPNTINLFAVLFILFRLAFIACYLADKALLRSLMWTGGFCCIIALFLAAI